MTIVSDKKRFAIRNDRMAKRHCLGRRSRFVQERSIGDLEPSQIGDHRLKVEQGFEPALREFGLIRCVSGVPARVLENVSLDNWRRNAIGIATADKRARDLVLSGNPAEFGERFRLRFRFRQVQFSIEPDILWNGGFNQGIKIFEADLAQHDAHLVFVRTNVAARERIRVDCFFTPLHGADYGKRIALQVWRRA